MQLALNEAPNHRLEKPRGLDEDYAANDNRLKFCCIAQTKDCQRIPQSIDQTTDGTHY